MHPLINGQMVEYIRSTGPALEAQPNRVEIMASMELPYDRPAENVIIMGCQNLRLMPLVIQTFARILEQGGMDFTFLSKEYCCGNYLYRPAIKAKDEEAMEECRSYSKEFTGLNIEQMKKFGGRRIILFCSPCYPIYKHAFPDEDIIFYPQALSEVVGALNWPGEIDYYAGCYKLHRNFAEVPMDLKSTNDVFNKIGNLSINRIGAPACCYKPEGLAHMIDQVRTDYMVHICTGCYFQAKFNMPEDRQVRILMLPEFIEMIQEKGGSPSSNGGA
jgi:hypothetical protein